MKTLKTRFAVPLVKVIRNGQITIPKKFRAMLGIEEGDLLEIKMAKAGMLIKPKSVLDKNPDRDRFFRLVEKIRKNAKGADPEEIDKAIEEAVRAAKLATAEKIRATKQ